MSGCSSSIKTIGYNRQNRKMNQNLYGNKTQDTHNVKHTTSFRWRRERERDPMR